MGFVARNDQLGHIYTENRLSLLHKVKCSDTIANWRKETSSIWTEQQVSLAVDGAQKVGKL